MQYDFLYSYEFIWKLKWFIKNKVFDIKKYLYVIKNDITNKIEDAEYSGYFWKITLLPVFKSILYTSIVVFFDILLTKVVNRHIKSVPVFLNDIFSISQTLSIDKDLKSSFTQIITLIASIAGLFLALYYPILATVASTAYSKAKSNIRSILLDDPYSQTFVRQIALLAASSILILFFILFGLKPGLLLICFICLMTLRSLYAVVGMGFGIFRYYDPSNLIYVVIRKLYLASENATNNKPYSNDLNFQTHYRKLANEYFDQVREIISWCAQETNLQTTSYVKTIKQISAFLFNYCRLKLRIPANSAWYPEEPKHPSYFTADSTSREIYTRIERIIEPKMVKNIYWVEQTTADIITESLVTLLKDKRYLTILEVFQMIANIAGELGKLGDYYTVTYLMNKLGPIILQMFTDDNVGAKKDADSLKEHLSIMILYVNIFEQFEVECYKRLCDFEKDELTLKVKNFNWFDGKFDDLNLFPSIYSSLEKHRKTLLFESKVEGSIVTPSWYNIQYVFAQIVEFISNALNEILKQEELSVSYLYNEFSNKEYLIPLLYTAHVKLHYYWKLNSHLSHLKNIVGKINTHKKQRDIVWKAPDFENLQQRLNNQRENCIKIISNNILKVSSLPWSDNVPDIFGKSYELLCRELNDSLFDDDKEKFNLLFPICFDLCLTTYDNLVVYVKKQEMESMWQAKVVTQVIIDLLQLSGLCLIYSELYDKAWYREVCVESWNKLLNKMSDNDEKECIQLFINRFVFYKRVEYEVGIGFERQQYRQVKLFDKLRKLNLVNGNTFYSYDNDEEIRLPEDQTLIFKITGLPSRLGNFQYDLADIFIEMVLKARIASKDIKTNMRRDFYDDIMRKFGDGNN